LTKLQPAIQQLTFLTHSVGILFYLRYVKWQPVSFKPAPKLVERELMNAEREDMMRKVNNQGE